jgi:hypothetical protein
MWRYESEPNSQSEWCVTDGVSHFFCQDFETTEWLTMQLNALSSLRAENAALRESRQADLDAAVAARTREIDKLRGQLQNCVNLLHTLKRHGRATDANAADKAIDSANRVLYETLHSERFKEGE